MEDEDKTPTRRGGCQTAEAKAKVGAAMRNHKRIRSSKPRKCQVCKKRPPIDHVKVNGKRRWMCASCFNADDEEYLSTERDRHTYLGASNLSRARG